MASVDVPGSLDSQKSKAKRKSYTREFKLKVVTFYRENNLYQTSKFFSLNTKTVLRWAQDEQKIEKAKQGSKHVEHNRRAMYPEVEAELYREYRQLRKHGLKVKGYWFKVRAKQLLAEKIPEASFLFSDDWFDAFKQCHRISLRRATNVSQKPADDKRGAIQGFHLTIREVAREGEIKGPLGQFQLHQVANMGQTPLPFCFSNGETYADTGDKTVWVRGGASGLEKRQCTAQLTVFADGQPRVKPLLTFRGKGKRISFLEKVSKNDAYLGTVFCLHQTYLSFPSCSYTTIAESKLHSRRTHGVMRGS